MLDPQTRQQLQTTVINRDNSELNLKARTTNTLAAVRSAYWDYVFAIQAIDVAPVRVAQLGPGRAGGGG